MKKLLLVSTLTSLGLLLGACGQSNSSTNAESKHQHKTEEVKEIKEVKEVKKEKKEQKKTYKLGEKAVCSYIENTFIVTNVEKVISDAQYIDPNSTPSFKNFDDSLLKLKKDEQYVLVDITQENNSKKKLQVAPGYFKLKGGSNKLYETVTGYKLLPDNKRFSVNYLSPGRKTKGKVIFVTKMTEKNFKLIYTPSSGSKENEVTIDLTK
ncbi:DUF4352 domain-containing protein [Bacillus changyiensis]|uniref:DUF4352 domain-containing protein n=1 Tax=Bacillus changyiensis TaxID=3004103 RepID=UPI0022E63F76|nr:DUF4352 domain-containing protein [Bacillus changyiensis]MDA1476852.1 DUF4352 domain-containing protein [Bacillus changyiensis]